MTQGNKVVNLQAQRAMGQPSLPSVLVRLRDVSGKGLRNVLTQFFDSSDDALFNLAEKAGTNQDQEAFFNAMRELRLRRKNITVSILQCMSRSFNEVGRFDPAIGGDELEAFDQDSLTLMDDADLEQKVAIDNLTAKLRTRNKETLGLLAARVRHLLPNIQLEDRQIPLSPEVICSGLSEACGDLDIDIRAKLTVLKLFDHLLTSTLEKLYSGANQLLAQEGVLPNLKRPTPASRTAEQSTVYRNPPMASRKPDSAGVLPVDSRITEAMASARGQATFSELSALLHQEGIGVADGGGSGRVELDTHGLMTMLSDLQKPAAELQSQAPGSLSEQLKIVLHPASGQGYSVRQVDNDVINLVSMLFDFILEDRQLAAPMKALIARLQIPVLKVALVDQGFFNRGGHPARKLLNELALAAIGWVEKPEGQRDPLKDKIEWVVCSLLDNFSDNVDLFGELLADFSRFMDLDRRRRELVEQRLKDAEEGRALQERAKTVVDETLAEVVGDRDLPDVVRSLLSEPWRKYLQWLILRKGDNSPEWAAAVELSGRLVWSVAPAPYDANTRTELLRAIPGIVDGLRKGLQTISWDPFATDNTIRDLELAHVDVFQQLVTSKAEVASTEAAVEAVAPEAATLETSVSDAGDPVGAEATMPEGVPDLAVAPLAAAGDSAAEEVDEAYAAWLSKADSLPVGSWVELLSGDNRVRCKLAAFIKATGKFIFVNRSGAKVAELHREELARSLADGKISMLDDGLIFDRALESIIDNLRHSRRD
ncbi:DUF1631 domain-containing protein [Marinobacter zhejiangensis]|uniref:Thymidine phosphorylase n=1 Tax=Marinobacter zhejiangensis TaxID=488535 RepID=A0A1I4RCA4_9GAMM|nr:DUF1631 domain-containing protein [Marinobacter zhejiangensis]SFM49871.1 Protein of unknown function [Marinobacter zhejiangensis]